MLWNGFLADAIAWQLLLVPAILVAAKLGYPRIRWWMIWLLAAMLGWLLSVGYFLAFPPDMGFGQAAARILGWLPLLPVVGIFSGVWFVREWRGSRGARVVTIALLAFAIALPLTACVRWISEEQARRIATEELQRRGFANFHVGEEERTWDGWTVHAELSTKETCPVHLSRSGFCSGMGG